MGTCAPPFLQPPPQSPLHTHRGSAEAHNSGAPGLRFSPDTTKAPARERNARQDEEWVSSGSGLLSSKCLNRWGPSAGFCLIY